MNREKIYVRPAVGPCEIHEWPDAGLPARLFLKMRERQRKGQGGVDACRDCLVRAKHVAAKNAGIAVHAGDTATVKPALVVQGDDYVRALLALAADVGAGKLPGITGESRNEIVSSLVDLAADIQGGRRSAEATVDLVRSWAAFAASERAEVWRHAGGLGDERDPLTKLAKAAVTKTAPKTTGEG